MDVKTTRRFLVALVKALRDSTETGELLVGEEISSVGRMDALKALIRSTNEGRLVLKDKPVISTATVDFDALRALPPGTLGREYVDHLDRCGLDPDALLVPVTRGSDAISNYLLERIRQTHDIWHALLGLGAEGHEEVLVHAFQWPQLRMPYSALVVFFGTFKHLIGEGRWRLLTTGLRDAHQAGRDALPLLPIYWERYWGDPVADLRQRLRIRPASEWPSHRAFAA